MWRAEYAIMHVKRVLGLTVAVALFATGGSVHATDPTDPKESIHRGADGYFMETFLPVQFGPNYFWVMFSQRSGAPANPLRGSDGRPYLRVWVNSANESGPDQRFFSNVPGDVGEPFADGPIYDPYHYGVPSTIFGLPTGFRSETIVDVWQPLQGYPSACAPTLQPSDCTGARAFAETTGMNSALRYFTPDFPGKGALLDANDNKPEPLYLD